MPTRTLDAGQAVLLIGTDCPQLDERRLRQAARDLQCHDATMFPAFDGGYALLGLNQFHSSLFTGLAWSTDTVAAQTLDRLKALNWTVNCHPTVHDIDEPADLKWLDNRPKPG